MNLLATQPLYFFLNKLNVHFWSICCDGILFCTINVTTQLIINTEIFVNTSSTISSSILFIYKDFSFRLYNVPLFWPKKNPIILALSNINLTFLNYRKWGARISEIDEKHDYQNNDHFVIHIF